MPMALWCAWVVFRCHTKRCSLLSEHGMSIGFTWNTRTRVGFCAIHPSSSSCQVVPQYYLLSHITYCPAPMQWSMHIGQQLHYTSGFWWQCCRDANSSSTSSPYLSFLKKNSSYTVTWMSGKHYYACHHIQPGHYVQNRLLFGVSVESARIVDGSQSGNSCRLELWVFRSG